MSREPGRGERGQALVEIALAAPVLILLFLGVYTAADLLSDKDTVNQAVRQGARLAAELGNGGYPKETLSSCQSGDAANPCAVDQSIVQATLPLLKQQLPHVSVTEIDVYRPQPCAAGTSWGSDCPPDDGAFQAGDLIDRFKADGSPLTSSDAKYTLDLRLQTHPNEASIGVRVLYHYTSPTLLMFSMDQSEYGVVRLAPKFT